MTINPNNLQYPRAAAEMARALRKLLKRHYKVEPTPESAAAEVLGSLHLSDPRRLLHEALSTVQPPDPKVVRKRVGSASRDLASGVVRDTLLGMASNPATSTQAERLRRLGPSLNVRAGVSLIQDLARDTLDEKHYGPFLCGAGVAAFGHVMEGAGGMDLGARTYLRKALIDCSPQVGQVATAILARIHGEAEALATATLALQSWVASVELDRVLATASNALWAAGGNPAVEPMAVLVSRSAIATASAEDSNTASLCVLSLPRLLVGVATLIGALQDRAAMLLDTSLYNLFVGHIATVATILDESGSNGLLLTLPIVTPRGPGLLVAYRHPTAAAMPTQLSGAWATTNLSLGRIDPLVPLADPDEALDTAKAEPWAQRILFEALKPCLLHTGLQATQSRHPLTGAPVVSLLLPIWMDWAGGVASVGDGMDAVRPKLKRVYQCSSVEGTPLESRGYFSTLCRPFVPEEGTDEGRD